MAIEKDVNDFWLVTGSPVLKVGILEYLGKEISPSLEPEKLYKVMINGAELSRKETIESLNGLPLLLDHKMLGKDFASPDSEKLHGVVYNGRFENESLKADIKIFSDEAKNKIQKGEDELSLGYRCKFVPAQNQEYDFEQKNILANHLIITESGRGGEDVAIVYNTKSVVVYNELPIIKMGDIKMDESILTKLSEVLASAGIDEETIAKVKGLLAQNEPADEPVVEEKKEEEEVTENHGDEEIREVIKEEVGNEDKGEDAAETAENSKRNLIKEIDERNELYKSLTPHIGEFAVNSMTLKDVAKYACNKLKLKVSDGQEVATINGYLVGCRKTTPRENVAMNKKVASSSESSFIQSLFN